jgi:4'-phosphopantetheinyl transferase
MTFPFPVWDLPPEAPLLQDDQVHVWRARLDSANPCVGKLGSFLSEEEQTRAARFHFRRDQDRFVITRGLLRVILDRYLGVGPAQLEFCYNAYGKPSLAPRCENEMLRFSVSHSRDLVIYAIACGRQVGVDVEYMHADIANEGVAAQFFSPAEVAALRSLPPAARVQGFYNCWTRKEAYVKAKGLGLSLPLDQFDVSLAPGEPARLLGVQGDSQGASRWSMRELTPSPGYAGAVVASGNSWSLACWGWKCDAHF